MSDKPSVLVLAAVLTSFLARHPEIEQLPIEWSFRERDGILAYLSVHTDPRIAQRAADLLADILQADLYADDIRLDRTGWVLARSIGCHLHGAAFYFTASSPLHGPAPAPAAR